MDMNFKLEGMIVPVVVPFSDNFEIDEDAFRQEIRFFLSAGVDGISSGGSTGEGAILRTEELDRCLEIIREENHKKIPVVAGIIRNSTRDAVDAAMRAKAIGVDALLVTPVFYYGSDDRGNCEYYRAIGEATGLPIIIYNVVPTNLISPEVFLQLLEIDWVVGIKQVDPVNLVKMCSISEEHGGTVYSACDHMLYGTYVSGARGAISALITVAPELCVEQWKAFKTADQARASEIQRRLAPIVNLYSDRPFPGKVKELINLQGRSVGVARSPNTMPTDAERESMKTALRRAGLLS